MVDGGKAVIKQSSEFSPELWMKLLLQKTSQKQDILSQLEFCLFFTPSRKQWIAKYIHPLSSSSFFFKDPFVMALSPERGPKAGGTVITITGQKLLTGRASDLTVTVGGVPCVM